MHHWKIHLGNLSPNSLAVHDKLRFKEAFLTVASSLHFPWKATLIGTSYLLNFLTKVDEACKQKSFANSLAQDRGYRPDDDVAN